MLFQVRFHDGIKSGAISITYRCWQTARVKVGGRYRFGLRHQADDYLVVDAVDTVSFSSIRDVDARRAGFKNRTELRNLLTKHATTDTHLFRISFHYSDNQQDVRVALRQEVAPDQVAAVIEKMRRMDTRSSGGPWTRAYLALIQQHPLVAASRLAPQVGREVLPFKTDVRKLKALGLTISHQVGYELSPRGHAVMAALTTGC